jgi:hypothetical protein
MKDQFQPESSGRVPAGVGKAESRRALLQVLGQKGVGCFLRVQRALYVEDNVMPEIIDRFAHRHDETVESARKDINFLKIGLPLDRLAKLCWCPVVLLADQNDGRR